MYYETYIWVDADMYVDIVVSDLCILRGLRFDLERLVKVCVMIFLYIVSCQGL